MLEMLLQMMVVTMKIGALVPCRRHDAVGDRRGTQVCLHTLALVTPEKAFAFRGKDCQLQFLPPWRGVARGIRNSLWNNSVRYCAGNA